MSLPSAGSRWLWLTLGVVIGVAGLLATLVVPASAQSDEDDPFYSGPISGPEYCLAMSLGGPATFAFDSDGDGVADICSLDRSRRETAARQQALERLGGEFGSEFDTLFAEECERVAESFGEPEAEASDECARIAAGEDVSVVVPPLPEGDAYDLFFSGPVITGPSFCLNLSFGGPVTYPFDSDGDGIADVCSLPRTKRAAVARQRALESLSHQQPERFEALVIDECAGVPETFGETEAEATDACEPVMNPPELEEEPDPGPGSGSGGGSGGSGFDLSQGLDIDLNFGQNNNHLLLPQDIVVAPGTGNLVVGWNAPTQDADSVFEYEVQYSVNPNFSDSEIAIMILADIEAPCRLATDSNRFAGETYQCTLDDLDNLTPYYVRVRAARAGETARLWTSGIVATPGVPVKPVWAANPSSSDFFQQLTVRWLPALGTTTEGYLVQWSPQGRFVEDCSTSPSCSQEVGGATDTSRTIPMLEYGRTYSFRVRGTNADGSGPWSSTIRARVVSSLPAPGVPRNVVVATGGTGNVLVISWEAPATGPTPTNYVVQARSITDNEPWSTSNSRQFVLPADSLEAGVPELTGGDRYEVRVAAINTTRPSAWTTPKQITLGEAAPPTELTAESGTVSGYINLAWTEVASVPATTSYTVQANTSRSFPADCAAATSCTEATVTAPATGYAIIGLTDGTTYYIRVRAVNTSGGGPWTPTVNAKPGALVEPELRTTIDTGPLFQNPTQVRLAFLVTEETTKSPLTGFRIRWRDISTTTWTERFYAASEFTDPTDVGISHQIILGGFTPGVAYDFQGRTVNANGNSPWSNTVRRISGNDWRINTVAFAVTAGNNLEVVWARESSFPTVGKTYADSLTLQLRSCGTAGATCGAWGNTVTLTDDIDVLTYTYASPPLTSGNHYQVRIRLNGKGSIPNGPWGESNVTQITLF